MQSTQQYAQREASNASTSASSALTSTSASPQVTPTAAPAHPSSISAFRVPSMHPPSMHPSIAASNGYGSAFAQFSPATEEILKRASANATAAAGTPGWEAAREQVLKSMVTSDTIALPTTGTTAGSKRGRGGSMMGSPLRPATAEAGLPATAEGTVGSEATGLAAEPKNTPMSGRGRGRGGPRGRGRGGGRGGKRKATGSDDSENDSDISSSYTPLPTRTKSGRNVQKPTTFSPALPSESSGTKRRRVSRKGPEATVCSVCSRGHTPLSNMIVFCDVCNTPYHQFCHDPPIDRDVVVIAEKEWFCGTCKSAKENTNLGVEGRIGGEDLTVEEKRAYLSTLSAATLVSLLVHATTVHPSLPIFPPNVKDILHPSSALAANPTSSATSEPVVAQSLNGYAINHSASHDNPALAPSNTHLSSAPQHDYHFQHHAPLPAPYNTTSSSSVPPPPQWQHHSQLPNPNSAAPTKDSLQPSEDPSPDADGELDQEHYDGYDTDPPAHYVKAGNGVAGKLMRPEADDLQWLVDDNFTVFSHTVRDPVDGRYVPVSSMGGLHGAGNGGVGGQWGGGGRGG